eukprot:scaffold46125_cov37-Tisochrysis_lutea.AAC.1
MPRSPVQRAASTEAGHTRTHVNSPACLILIGDDEGGIVGVRDSPGAICYRRDRALEPLVVRRLVVFAGLQAHAERRRLPQDGCNVGEV